MGVKNVVVQAVLVANLPGVACVLRCVCIGEGWREGCGEGCAWRGLRQFYSHWYTASGRFYKYTSKHRGFYYQSINPISSLYSGYSDIRILLLAPNLHIVREVTINAIN